MSDFKKNFGANLKKLRKVRNMTQEKLSELIDVHYRQMSKIETGENFPSSKTIEKLCIALKISPAMLFDFEFTHEGEALMTGTDNDVIFYKAITQDNVVILKDYNGQKVIKKDDSLCESEKSLRKIASNIGKPITVEYFEDGKRTKTLVYNPDGEIKSLNGSETYLTQEAASLMKLFESLSKHHEYTDFIKLAIESIEDDAALDRLEFMLNGIKLARKTSK